MPRDAALEPEDCNCFAMRSAARHVTQFYDHLLAPTGLRTTQFSILAKLKRLGPLTINGLAKAMLMDRTTLGRNVLPLERKRLITIGSGTSDRRAKVVQLTSAGEKRVQAARSAWSKAQSDFEGTFGLKRTAYLRGLLRAVVASEFSASEPERSRISPTARRP